MSSAAQIVIQTGDPQLSGVVNSTWRNEAGDAIHDYQFPAQGNMTSADMAAITMHGLLQVPGTDPASITLAGDHLSVTSTPLVDPLDDVLPGGSISWSTGSTAQERMLLSSPDLRDQGVACESGFCDAMVLTFNLSHMFVVAPSPPHRARLTTTLNLLARALRA
jgi:hypothetical protein